MHLHKDDGCWRPHFSQPWEVTALTEAGDVWVPFARSREHTPIGVIHAQSYAVRFNGNEPDTKTLAVSLIPPPSTQFS
jgi:hypothetical protein